MKTFTLEKTKNKELFRIVDRKGDWVEYFHEPTNTILRSVSAVLDNGYAAPGLRMWMASKSPEEIKRVGSEARETGDQGHQFIEVVLTSSGIADFGTKFNRHETLVLDKGTGKMVPIGDDAWDGVLSWARFMDDHKPIVIFSEMPVYDLKLLIAGTLDAPLILTTECALKICPCHELIGKLGIFDWKFSSALRPENSAQLGGYALAESLKMLLKGRELDYAANVRLGTNHKTTGGYEFKAYTDLEEIKGAFLAAKLIADRDYKPFEPAALDEEIPDEIEVAVNRKVPAKKKKGMKKNANN